SRICEGFGFSRDLNSDSTACCSAAERSVSSTSPRLRRRERAPPKPATPPIRSTCSFAICWTSGALQAHRLPGIVHGGFHSRFRRKETRRQRARPVRECLHLQIRIGSESSQCLVPDLARGLPTFAADG